MRAMGTAIVLIFLLACCAATLVLGYYGTRREVETRQMLPRAEDIAP